MLEHEPLRMAPRSITRLRAATVALLSLALAVAAEGLRPGYLFPVPVKIVAYVGTAIEGVRPEFTWKVSYGSREYPLYLLKLEVLDGRATPLGIQAAVEPYGSRFDLAGIPAAIEALINAPPRQQVVIECYLRFESGSSYLILDTVNPAAPTPAPATPTES